MNRDSYKLNIAEPEIIADEHLTYVSGGMKKDSFPNDEPHTGISFDCPYCGKRYSSEGGVEGHIKNKHRGMQIRPEKL